MKFIGVGLMFIGLFKKSRIRQTVNTMHLSRAAIDSLQHNIKRKLFLSFDKKWKSFCKKC